MKFVQIKRHHRQYTPGDITGFDDEQALKLIDLGIADEYEPGPSDAKALRNDASKAGASKSVASKPAAARG